MVSADMHCHAMSTKSEAIVETARRNKIKSVGLLDYSHAFSDYSFAHMYCSLPDKFTLRLSEYRDTADYLEANGVRVLFGLKILFGTGMEIVHQGFSNTTWDFMLASLEYVDGISIFEYQPQNDAESRRLWSRYLKLQTQMLNECRCNIIAHPIALASSKMALPHDFNRRLTFLVQTAKQKGIAVELNSEDYRQSPEVFEMLVSICAEQNAEVTFGSAAVNGTEIGRHFMAIDQIAVRYGIKNYVVFEGNNSVKVPL